HRGVHTPRSPNARGQERRRGRLKKKAGALEFLPPWRVRYSPKDRHSLLFRGSYGPPEAFHVPTLVPHPAGLRQPVPARRDSPRRPAGRSAKTDRGDRETTRRAETEARQAEKGRAESGHEEAAHPGRNRDLALGPRA